MNHAYFNNASLNRKMDAANALSATPAAAAYSKLDLEIMRDFAPWAPFMIINNRAASSRRGRRTSSSPSTSRSRSTAPRRWGRDRRLTVVHCRGAPRRRPPAAYGTTTPTRRPPLGQFLIRRTLWAIFLFFAATIVTFVIFFVIPADPAALSAGKAATQEDVDAGARVRSTSTSRSTSSTWPLA